MPRRGSKARPKHRLKKIPSFYRDSKAFRRSAKWKALRKRMLDGAVCARCGTKRSLTVHHKHLVRESQLSHSDPQLFGRRNLEVLCKSCHRMRHDD